MYNIYIKIKEETQFAVSRVVPLGGIEFRSEQCPSETLALIKHIAPYHNWLVSRTVSPEVVGSNPIGVTKYARMMEWKTWWSQKSLLRACRFESGFGHHMVPSSSWTGSRPLKPVMRVRIPLVSPGTWSAKGSQQVRAKSHRLRQLKYG